MALSARCKSPCSRREFPCFQHLNAHATSTPVGDHGELEAIKIIFGTNGGVAVSSTKSATGHLLGAAGGLEAILALRDQIAPETLNLDNPDPSAEGIDLVRGRARAMKIDHVLSNGFGFGGVNASVVLRKM
jgi:3-oxoacyl-[acyl-carrier-protein] synthase II